MDKEEVDRREHLFNEIVNRTYNQLEKEFELNFDSAGISLADCASLLLAKAIYNIYAKDKNQNLDYLMDKFIIRVEPRVMGMKRDDDKGSAE